VIVALNVDDINLFDTPALTFETRKTLKGIFEMKDLGEPGFCSGLQFDYLPQGILINQATYTKRIIKEFNMHNAHPVSTPMELRSLDPDNDTFKKRMENEQVLGPKKPYLSAIGALMYLANQTRPDIAFAVS
jgi:hypothetical protein